MRPLSSSLGPQAAPCFTPPGQIPFVVPRLCDSCARCPALLGPWLLSRSPAQSAAPRQREPRSEHRTAPPAASRCGGTWLGARHGAWVRQTGLGAPGGTGPGDRTRPCSNPPAVPVACHQPPVLQVSALLQGWSQEPCCCPTLSPSCWTHPGAVLGAGSATLTSRAPSVEGQEHGPPPCLSPH